MVNRSHRFCVYCSGGQSREKKSLSPRNVRLSNISGQPVHRPVLSMAQLCSQDIMTLIFNVTLRISFLCCAEVGQSAARHRHAPAGNTAQHNLMLAGACAGAKPARRNKEGFRTRTLPVQISYSANNLNIFGSKDQHAGVLIHLRDLATTIPDTDIAVPIHAH